MKFELYASYTYVGSGGAYPYFIDSRGKEVYLTEESKLVLLFQGNMYRFWRRLVEPKGQATCTVMSIQDGTVFMEVSAIRMRDLTGAHDNECAFREALDALNVACPHSHREDRFVAKLCTPHMFAGQMTVEQAVEFMIHTANEYMLPYGGSYCGAITWEHERDMLFAILLGDQCANLLHAMNDRERASYRVVLLRNCSQIEPIDVITKTGKNIRQVAGEHGLDMVCGLPMAFTYNMAEGDYSTVGNIFP